MTDAPAHTRFEAHRRAKRTDATDVLTPGEQYTTVLLEAPTDRNPSAAAKVRKVRTFIRPGPGLSRDQLHQGRTVHIKITDVGDSHANAMAMALLE